MRDIDNLKRFGNLFESLVSDKVKMSLLRVYGYESMVGNVYYYECKEYMETEDEQNLLSVLKFIRKEVDKLGWNDNKIVCEICVGSWRVFIGFWDDYVRIGGSVIPNLYPPKYKEGEFGLEKITLRGGEQGK